VSHGEGRATAGGQPQVAHGVDAEARAREREGPIRRPERGGVNGSR
jgi:hypothetical protein